VVRWIGTMRQGCGLSAVSAWIAVRLVPVVRLIAFWFPGPGCSPRRWSIVVVRTTTMEHCRGCAAVRDRAGAGALTLSGRTFPADHRPAAATSVARVPPAT
jgi:hypothetical protein